MDEATGKALTPQARALRERLVGQEVEMQDGSMWVVPALPLGKSGGPISKLMDEVAISEAELDSINAKQMELSSTCSPDEYTGHYAAMQKQIRKAESRMLDLQLRFCVAALRLHYDVSVDEFLEADLLSLRQVRQITTIVAGVPQIDEFHAALKVMREEFSGAADE